MASAWGGSPSEYWVDELDVVDDDGLGLIDVDDLRDRDDTDLTRLERSQNRVRSSGPEKSLEALALVRG